MSTQYAPVEFGTEWKAISEILTRPGSSAAHNSCWVDYHPDGSYTVGTIGRTRGKRVKGWEGLAQWAQARRVPLERGWLPVPYRADRAALPAGFATRRELDLYRALKLLVLNMSDAGLDADETSGEVEGDYKLACSVLEKVEGEVGPPPLYYPPYYL